MATKTLPTITSLQAQAAANLFLSDRLPDRFTAGSASFDQDNFVWRVPVLLTYPVIGSIGQVGEVQVSARFDEVKTHTSVAEMKSAALALYEKHRHEIEAQVS